MHAIHHDPRRLLAVAAAALALTIATLALPSVAGDLDLSSGGGSQAAPAAPAEVRSAPAQPRWVADPLTPPSVTAR